MRIIAILLTTLLMAALLVSCAGMTGITNPDGTTSVATSDTGTTSGGTSVGTSTATSGTTDRSTSGGTSGGTSKTSGTSNAGNAGMNAASSAVSGLVSGLGMEGMNPEEARIMYNNTLYKGSREELHRDELGQELSAVTVVERNPDANGEAAGVAANSRLYSIKNVNDYSAIAFECGGVYYRAQRENA